MRRRVLFWLVVFAGWTLLVIVFAVSSSLTYVLTYQPPRWSYTFTMAATDGTCGRRLRRSSPGWRAVSACRRADGGGESSSRAPDCPRHLSKSR